MSYRGIGGRKGIRPPGCERCREIHKTLSNHLRLLRTLFNGQPWCRQVWPPPAASANCGPPTTSIFAWHLEGLPDRFYPAALLTMSVGTRPSRSREALRYLSGFNERTNKLEKRCTLPIPVASR